MTEPAATRLRLDPASPSAERGEALWWSQAWAVAILAAGLLVGLANGYLPWPVVGALQVMAAPAGMMQLLRTRDSDGVGG